MFFMLSKRTFKVAQEDNCNPGNHTTITILILGNELEYWKYDICIGLLTMGDGIIDFGQEDGVGTSMESEDENNYIVTFPSQEGRLDHQQRRLSLQSQGYVAEVGPPRTRSGTLCLQIVQPVV